MEITFSDEFRWQPEWIVFPADVDGRSLECRVTRGVLDDRFGAEPNRSSEESAYRLYSDAIHDVARRLIEAGEIDADGVVTVTRDAVFQYDSRLVH